MALGAARAASLAVRRVTRPTPQAQPLVGWEKKLWDDVWSLVEAPPEPELLQTPDTKPAARRRLTCKSKSAHTSAGAAPEAPVKPVAPAAPTFVQQQVSGAVELR